MSNHWKVVLLATLIAVMGAKKCFGGSALPDNDTDTWLVGECACKVNGAPDHINVVFTKRPTAYSLPDIQVQVASCAWPAQCNGEGDYGKGKWTLSNVVWSTKTTNTINPPHYYYYAKGKIGGNSYREASAQEGDKLVETCWKHCDSEHYDLCQGLPTDQETFDKTLKLFSLIEEAKTSSDGEPTVIPNSAVMKAMDFTEDDCKRSGITVSPSDIGNQGPSDCAFAFESGIKNRHFKGDFVLPKDLAGKFVAGDKLDARFSELQKRPRLVMNPPDEVFSGEMLGLRKTASSNGHPQINYVINESRGELGCYAMFVGDRLPK